MLVSIDQIDDSASRYNSWKHKSGREVAARLPEEVLIEDLPGAIPENVLKGNILSSQENREKRKEMLEAVSQEPLEFAYERAIGNNDSVYSNFCELISSAKQKVGRIVVKEGSSNIGYATGFMVSERLLLTNWHVFQNEESVAQSEVEFYYELDVFGRPGKPVVFTLNRNDFFYSFKELDYCFVAVDPVDVTGSVHLSSVGYIFLDPSLGKLADEGKELLNIIHHPDGDYKQLSIRENLFTKIMPATLWYESDTSQGSSGSPVFNDQWQVVALHHMGVPSKTADGDFYLDKNGNRIEPVNGKIDISKIHWIANEGIRISVILKDIFSKYPASTFINSLKVASVPAQLPVAKTAADLISSTTIHPENHNTMESETSNNVRISFPASLIETNGNITININNRLSDNAPVLQTTQKKADSVTDEDLQEILKVKREDAVDYTNCRGYITGFLGINIPMPKPKKIIQKYVAKLKGSDATILKYYHYSVIFNSVRMMPFISAINIDGDPDKRKDTTDRVDDWLRDNRLNYAIQLNDKYYKGSGFDKGHLSRREDANWGNTPDLAKLYADMTCMYTNACPQVAKLNQSRRGGLWGKLENLVLEYGALQEQGATAKLSVFNGPVFAETDPVFRGVQLPMEFFKIILWFNSNKKLKATAFKLSQKSLVDDIDFEALDFDTNVEFQEYQCSIKSLEELTKINFSDIIQYDTYDAGNGKEAMKLHTEEEIRVLISRNS